MDIASWMEPKVLDSPEVTKKLIGNHPNTYCFTKAVAESVLETQGKALPIGIFR